MGVRSGLILPHAPVIARGRPEVDVFARSAEKAVETLGDCDVVVILSPHGAQDGLYRAATGSLADMGLELSIDAPTDDAATSEIAGLWDRPVLDARCDHGIVGALSIAAPHVPIVACAVAEVSGPDHPGAEEQAIESGLLFADALQRSDRRIGFVASAHTAASLTPKAPLTLRPEGKELDDFILDSLATDCGALARIDPELWRTAGSCGPGPLTAFGALFEGRRADVLAYDHPFGVGYLVAAATGE